MSAYACDNSNMQWSTAREKGNERAASFSNFLTSLYKGMRVAFSDRNTFKADMSGGAYGSMVIMNYSGYPMSARVTNTNSVSDRPSFYTVELVLDGCMEIETDDDGFSVKQGQLGLIDSTTITTFSFPTATNKISIKVPRSCALLAKALKQDAGQCVISSDEGTGLLLKNYILGMNDTFHNLEPRHLQSVTNAFLNLMDAAFCNDSMKNTLTNKERLFKRIKSYILHNIEDPHLSTAIIAKHNNISQRYVYRLFQEHGVSVGYFICQQRLNGAKSDLLDPGCAHLSITSIAYKWAFNDSAYFSRRFRQSTGMSPTQYRKMTWSHSELS